MLTIKEVTGSEKEELLHDILPKGTADICAAANEGGTVTGAAACRLERGKAYLCCLYAQESAVADGLIRYILHKARKMSVNEAEICEEIIKSFPGLRLIQGSFNIEDFFSNGGCGEK